MSSTAGLSGPLDGRQKSQEAWKTTQAQAWQARTEVAPRQGCQAEVYGCKGEESEASERVQVQRKYEVLPERLQCHVAKVPKVHEKDQISEATR